MSAPLLERAQIEALKKAYLAERAARQRAERMLLLTEEEVIEREKSLSEMAQAYAELEERRVRLEQRLTEYELRGRRVCG